MEEGKGGPKDGKRGGAWSKGSQRQRQEKPLPNHLAIGTLLTQSNLSTGVKMRMPLPPQTGQKVTQFSRTLRGFLQILSKNSAASRATSSGHAVAKLGASIPMSLISKRKRLGDRELYTPGKTCLRLAGANEEPVPSPSARGRAPNEGTVRSPTPARPARKSGSPAHRPAPAKGAGPGGER